MRILHVISSMDPRHGGVCEAVRSIAKGLSASVFRNAVVSLDDVQTSDREEKNLEHHALGPGGGPWCYGKKLRPWLDRNLSNYDVVIVHGLWLYHGFAVRRALRDVRLAAKRRMSPEVRVPLCFVMPHGMLDPYFQRDPARRLKAIRNRIYWKWFERKLVNEADGMLFTCEEEKLLARTTFSRYAPKQESVVGLGVAEPPVLMPAMKVAFKASCPGIGERPYFLFLSRIHPKKGVDLLIRAYAQLAKEHHASVSHDYFNSKLSTSSFPSLVIAGPLDSAYSEEMQQLAAELLPSQQSTLNPQPSTSLPSIHFPGMLTGDAKWGAFYGCEAFILPSHQENFGIAVVESLACGKPVLISKNINIWREIIQAGAGFAGDANLEGAGDLMKEWLNLEDWAKDEMQTRAIRCFNEFFTTDANALKIEEVLKEAGGETFIK